MSELPEGWAEAPLELLTSKIGSGATPKGGSNSYEVSGVPLIRSQNIHFDGFTEEGLVYLNAAQASALENANVRSNDVLLNITGASIGRVCSAPPHMDGSRVNQHVAIVRPLPRVLVPRFLALYLRAPAVQARINSEEYGVTRQALTKAWISELHVPVPPLAEQHRIVDKVESLTSSASEAQRSSLVAAEICRRLLRTIYTAAVDGKLTESWRAQRGVEPWTTARAADVCSKVQSGGTPEAGFTSSGVPFLKVYNVVDQRVDFRRSQYVSENVHRGELKKSITYPGDVLMNIVGPPLGKVAIVPESYAQWNINQALTLFRPSKRINSEWLYILLVEGRNTAHVMNDTKGIVGQVNISLSQCRDFEFPLPSPEEQREIAKRVHDLVRSVNVVAQRVASARERLGILAGAILEKAFTGDLVPTEAELARREGRTYEPGAALLERIRANNDETPAARAGRGRRARALDTCRYS